MAEIEPWEVALWTEKGELVARWDLLPWDDPPGVMIYRGRYFTPWPDSYGDYRESRVHFLDGQPAEVGEGGH